MLIVSSLLKHLRLDAMIIHLRNTLSFRLIIKVT